MFDLEEFTIKADKALSIKEDVIKYLLSTKGEEYPILENLANKNLSIFPDEWNWNVNYAVYHCDNKKISGSLAKRIRKFLNYRYSISLSEENMGGLGEILRVARNRTTQFHCKFVDNFDWNPGDFGDYRSCFWTQRKLAKKVLLEAKARPVLFYRDGKGIARAITINHSHLDNCLVIFNAYGMVLTEIVSLLAKHFKCKHKIVSILKKYDPYNLVHINKNVGGILYNENGYDDTSSIELNNIDANQYRQCQKCRHFDYKYNLTYHDIENVYYCDGCY